jgi:diaminopimelate decarboxylase
MAQSPRPAKVSRHAPEILARFPVKDGVLQIGGVPLDRLAARVGATPFYAYDRALITARIRDLRRRLPKAVNLNYAMKANPMPAVVQHLAGLVDGIDVASVREMQVALDTPMPAERISFAGPGKTADQLSRAVAAGIVINLESEDEMRAAAKAGKALGVQPRVAVRVNPDFGLKASGMHMGGGAQQFGVDAERVPAMLKRIGTLGLAFEGFHIFSGSQNLRADILIDTQAKTIDLALALAKHAPGPLRHLNIGGGFGVPYFPGDAALDIAPVGKALGERLKAAGPALSGVRVMVELGRYIVGEAGVYVCRVTERKLSRGEVFLVTDGGLHHHLAASGNFGQVIRRNYPVAVGTRMGAAKQEAVNVVGPLCTPLDLLGAKMTLPRAAPGDLVVVFQSGAYGLTASPTAFLSHPPPAEILV